MKPCTAIVYSKTGKNLVLGGLQPAKSAAHDKSDGLFVVMLQPHMKDRVHSSTRQPYYVIADYLGFSITDASGNVFEKLSYGPWEGCRNPNNWTDYTVQSTLFNHGYTGHEHLGQFGLINMNGRVYDPFLARFLSPDPQLQSPDYSQNYNRYSYAWNNPLKYTDPSGEFIHLVIGAAIGGVFNWIANGAQFNAAGLGHFGVGALAGGLGAGIGAGFGALASGAGHFSFMSAAALSAPGFGAGAAAGFGAGFTGGLVTGTGNSLLQNENIGKALSNGLNSALWGGTIGGFAGGITGGIRATRGGRDFWSGGYKKTTTETILADAGIPSVRQEGLNDCLPACLQGTDESLGGSMTQQEIRSWYGGDGSLLDIDVVERYSSETSRSYEALSMIQRSEYINSMSDKINTGQKIILNLRQTGNVGHAVAVNRVIERTVQYAPGLRSSSIVYQVMDPWSGSFRSVSAGDMIGNFIKAWNVFVFF